MNRSASPANLNLAGASNANPGLSTDALAAHYRAIAEIDGDVAWIIDCARELPLYMSPAVEQLLGYTADEFGQHLSGAAAQPALAALCAGLPQRLQRFAAGDQSRLRVVRQFELEHKQGRPVVLEAVSVLLCDNSGQAHAIAGVLRDIGPQRALEAAQRRFASMLNHEFRTPLSTIDGAIQLLEVTGAGADEATRRRYRKIGDAVERLIGMLDEHLSPDRIAAIGGRRPADSVAPRALLEQGAARLRTAGRPATLELGDLPLALRCAPEGVQLALQVLLDNVLHYAPAGTPVALSGCCADGGIELLVRDFGPGVAPDETDSIFERGYRGRNSGNAPGSGLGLYMARSVLDAQGGSVTMRNVDTQGAEFRIWLPVRNNVVKNLASAGIRRNNSAN
jgi:PAS domain S-box-containing protein